MSSGDASFHTIEEAKIAVATPVAAPVDSEDAHSDVSDEEVSSRAPAIVIID